MSLEDHRNPNGTYNGVKALAELTGLPQGEILATWESVKANHAKLAGCPWHEFERTKGVLHAATHEYTCKHCGGTVNHIAYHWHELGRRPMPAGEP